MMFPRLSSFVVGSTVALASVASANVTFTGSYTQNFNGMSTGTTAPADWFVGGLAGTDGAVDGSGNGAITGKTVQVDNGSVPAGSGTIGHYNYGATGDTASRSLGSIATTARGNRAMEVRLDNRTGYAIASFEIRYTGKQWRLEDSGDQALVMLFSTDGVNFLPMGPQFDFHSIQDNGTAGALDGNTVRLDNIGGVYAPATPIPSGSTFYLRWFDVNDAGVADHGLAIDNVTVSNPTSTGTVIVFQDGLSGYAGTTDTYLQQINPNTSFGSTTPIKWDGEDGGGVDTVLMRFSGLFGTNAGQIQPTDVITSATLVVTVTDTGSTGSVHECLTPWAETVTYNTFGGQAGVQANEYGPVVSMLTGTPLGTQVADVTSSLLAWKVAGDPEAVNLGWMVRPTGTDGVQIRSREYATTPGERPKLVVVINGGAPAQKTLQMKHAPYLQLGNAPLVSTGPGIGTTDQIVIAWQTTEVGNGITHDDFFEAEYRAAGAGSYASAGAVSVLDVGEGTRVNRSVTITGLAYDSDYEYRVHHKRNTASPVLVTTYGGTIHTRKHPSSPQSFRFAAHGDSAVLTSPGELAQFENVNARITSSNAAFVMLLGDNIYDSGTHTDFDARLDATYAPINSAYIRSHIEYFCMGNHDANTANGLASLQNYYCPVPALGVTSPIAPAVGEADEKNYSFDYGMLHIAVIDSTAWGGPGENPARANAITAWLNADLAAHANSPWKIVAAHHPLKSSYGHTDTAGMAAQLVPVMVSRNVDLVLVGHSHNFQRSLPITGYGAGDVTTNLDPGGTYTKGTQVLQIIAGTGGRNIDGSIGSPNSATQWLAKAFVSDNGGTVGPMIVDVSTTQMTLKYTDAVTGAVKDTLTINTPGPTLSLSPTSLSRIGRVGGTLTNSTFTVRNSGIDTVNYTISDDATWMNVSPTGGSSTGEADTIDVAFDLSGLGAGTYNGTITVTSPEAANSPRPLPVTLTVQTVKPDFDGDGDVDQSDFAFFQRCLAGGGFVVTGPCLSADLQQPLDGDVDEFDFTVFLGCISGANILANPTCAN